MKFKMPWKALNLQTTVNLNDIWLVFNLAFRRAAYNTSKLAFYLVILFPRNLLALGVKILKGQYHLIHA